MPATKSQLINKLKTKTRGAWKKARETEPKARSGGGFPPNLKGLVGVCKNWKLGETKNGDPMIQLTAIVKDPTDYDGRRASFMWFINDSEYSTAADALEQFAGEIKLLIRPDEEVPGATGPGELPETEAEMLDVLAYLCETGRHVEFNSGPPRKNGSNPNLFIQGIPENWEDAPEEGAGEADGSDAGGNSNADAGGDAGEAQPGDDSSGDTGDAGDTGGDAGDEPWIPEKGQNYWIMAKLTPKDKAKKVEMEITKVDKKAHTVECKITDPKFKGRVVKGVKWSEDGSGDILGEE